MIKISETKGSKCYNLLSEIAEYSFDEDDGDNGSIPMVTLEVMSDASNTDLIIIDENYVNESTPNFDDTLNKETGVHFLTEQMNDESTSKQNEEKEGTKETPKGRHELLEYLLRHDGSVICKMCGEVLQTRTHWYRHKYKRHAPHQTNSTPLFQCEQCFVYFKSRKG